MPDVILTRRYAEHTGGTKFYEVIYAHSGTDSCLIQRWGALGKYGQVKHTYFTGDNLAASREASRIVAGKQKRGYEFTGSESKVVIDGLEISEAMRVWQGHSFNDDVYHELTRLLDSPEPTKPEAIVVSKPEPVRDDELWGSW